MSNAKLKASMPHVRTRRPADPVKIIFVAISCVAALVSAWALGGPEPAIRETIVSVQTTPPNAPSTDEPGEEPEIRVTDLMGRPLFRRDRRPGLPPPSEPEPEVKKAEVEMAANRRAALQRYQLSGTVLSKGYEIAILARAGDPKMLLIREGDELDGWMVAEIGSRAVTLKSGEETAELVFPAPKSPQGPQVTAAAPQR